MAAPELQPLGLFLQEQRSTNLRQSALIQDQQNLIELLGGILVDNGLGDILETNGIDRPRRPASSSESGAFSRTFGPTSAPIIWNGTDRDAIPLTIDGVPHRAQILAAGTVASWNRVMDLWVKLATCRQHHIQVAHSRATLQLEMDAFAEGRVAPEHGQERVEELIAECDDDIENLDVMHENTRFEIWGVCKAIAAEIMHPLFLQAGLRVKGDPTEWMTEIYGDQTGRLEPKVIADEDTVNVFTEGLWRG
ncbi:uncharacterized protein L3040_003489 [Drepanopeziza brunnea f. sp. 'multigermtubi']|uniref:uncharacterized protein n=1 Tax=Drepanopeziza brunnea f. sp. 'multigermtubi' TaxID=698441 RepID=UPI0023A47B05|nr:hypothetical protein L3040_003489 [Drepanopeziza brunnea f. sp. 'multigermtubi']